jgi:hypothetical protein
MGCADTESAAYDKAPAAFEEASSQLEELGFEYEITSDGVSFSRSDTGVEEYDPGATRIGAVPFLGLSGAVEVGSLDQVIDVSEFRSLNRCPVLVCPKSKAKGAKSTCYKFCANPSKFQVNARHFCGVHKLTFQNHPDALKEGRIFDCETDVVVCSSRSSVFFLCSSIINSDWLSTAISVQQAGFRFTSITLSSDLNVPRAIVVPLPVTALKSARILLRWKLDVYM